MLLAPTKGGTEMFYHLQLHPTELSVLRRLLQRGADGSAGLDRADRQLADGLIEYLDTVVKVQPGVSPGKDGE